MSPLEKETKLILSPEDQERLQKSGTVLESVDQLNVYLHDPTRLKEEYGYLRVRFESGRSPVATLKIPAGWKGGMRRMVEVERPLSDLGPSFFPWPRRWISIDPNVPEGFLEHFQALGITRLRRIGWMRNHRCVVRLGSLGSVEIDTTRLPNGDVHHEVEVENPCDETHRVLVERVKELAPSARISRIGKFSRFLSAMGLN